MTWSKGAIKPLTKQEVIVLECVLSGVHNPEIAEILELSTSTVKVHKHNAMKKLGLINKPKEEVLQGVKDYFELYAYDKGQER